MDERLEFIQQPGFAQMWRLVKKKYESYGRIAGTIRLSHLGAEERTAFEGLFAINMLGRSEIRFKLQELDAALYETKYKLSIVDSLSLLYGEHVVTRQEQTKAEQQSWERFCTWAGSYVKKTELKEWVVQLKQGKAPGYRAFLECYDLFREHDSCSDWVIAMQTLHLLPADMERLPVFAARTTGDSHGLDRTHLAGRIFYWGIVATLSDARFEEHVVTSEEEIESGTGSEEIRLKYERVGIVLDDMSSTVMIAGWKHFYMMPIALPLFTVDRLETVLPRIENVYVVENPSIFGALVDYWTRQCKPVPFPLLCTSGQPSLAALRLLDFTKMGDTQIHYNGDFDVKGVEMASLLCVRYGNRFVPWRMDCKTYASFQQPNLPSFSDREKSLLGRMQIGWDRKLTETMLEKGKKVFQEHILDKLLEDWKRREYS